MTNPDRVAAPTPAISLAIFFGIFAWFAAAFPFAITNWDDATYITANPLIRVLSLQNLLHIFTNPYFVNYHPLTVLSYAMDYSIAGLAPWIYHLQNAFWHAGSTTLLFLVLARVRVPVAVAALLAVWWGVHPLRAESVVWLSGRKDVLSTFFYLAAFLVHLVGNERPERYLRCVLPWEFALVLLAMFSKSMAVTYVGAIVVWDILTARGEVKGRLWAYAMFAVLTVLFAWANVVAQKEAIVPVGKVGLIERLSITAYSPWYYLSRMLVPVGLAPLHPRGLGPQPFTPPALLGAAATIALLATGAALWRRQPIVAGGIAWYFVTLSPVSGFITIGGAFAADRYSYLPTAGLVIAVAIAVGRLREHMRVPAAALVMVPVLVLNSMSYMGAFASSRTLWQRCLEVYPGFLTAHIALAHLEPDVAKVEIPLEAVLNAAQVQSFDVAENLALRIYEARGQRAEAIALLERSHNERGARTSLMRLHRLDGNDEEAARLARATVADPLAPSEQRALAVNLLLAVGEWDEAVAAAADTKRPSLAIAEVMGQIANVMLERGDAAGALTWIEHAESIDPTSFDVVRARAVYHSATATDAEGIGRLRRLFSRPDLTPRVAGFAHGMLGFFHDRSNQIPEALAAYGEAVASGYPSDTVLSNFAALLASTGQRDRAAALAARAEALTSAAPQE